MANVLRCLHDWYHVHSKIRALLLSRALQQDGRVLCCDLFSNGCSEKKRKHLGSMVSMLKSLKNWSANPVSRKKYLKSKLTAKFGRTTVRARVRARECPWRVCYNENNVRARVCACVLPAWSAAGERSTSVVLFVHVMASKRVVHVLICLGRFDILKRLKRGV